MKKEEAIRIMAACARQYYQNLENRNLLFLFGSPQAPEFFEAAFLPRHFLHLTGVEPNSGRVSSSTDFYDRCLKGRLTSADFRLPKNGTAEMKLAVLPQLMQIYRTAKMIGEYDSSKSLLFTERLAGNVSACLGFVRSDRYYIPNTALREDIRNITKNPQKRVLAIYRKPIHGREYTELCHTAKDVRPSELPLPNELRDRLAVFP